VHISIYPYREWVHRETSGLDDTSDLAIYARCPMSLKSYHRPARQSPPRSLTVEPGRGEEKRRFEVKDNGQSAFLLSSDSALAFPADSNVHGPGSLSSLVSIIYSNYGSLGDKPSPGYSISVDTRISKDSSH